ncbi:MAG: PKD domain-containing protein, partial [Dehalococcoidia bacterium]
QTTNDHAVGDETAGGETGDDQAIDDGTEAGQNADGEAVDDQATDEAPDDPAVDDEGAPDETATDEMATDETGGDEAATAESSLVADFDFEVECSPCRSKNVQFTDRSSGGTGNYTYAWDFGDGSNSTEQNPRHHYAGDGTYNVTLTVTDRAGKVASTSEIVTLVPKETTLEPLSTNSSTKGAPDEWPDCDWNCNAKDTKVTRLWLGDCTTGEELGTCNPGTPVETCVWATINNNAANRSQFYLIADLYINDVNQGKIVKCIGTIPEHSNAHYNLYPLNWTCGVRVELKNIVITWSTKPLTCEQPAHCHNHNRAQCYGPTNITVEAPLVADFDFNNVCCCHNTTFTDKTTGGKTPYAYDWDFGGNYTYSGEDPTGLPNPVIHYASAGTYTVTLNVTDDEGTTDSQSHNVTVYANPVADAGADKGVCEGSSVVIGGSPTASNGTPPYTYRWSPPAGLNDTEIANPAASPTGNTTYTVTVTDAHGCTDSDSVKVTVLPLPEAEFGANQTSGCAPLEI